MEKEILKKTILLVEDEAVNSIVISKKLEGFGYSVKAASSGEAAVDAALADRSIDLILVDIDLGSGIDGAETARQILVGRDIPVIFLTAYSNRETVEKVRSVTRYGYVIKNSPDILLQSSIEMAFDLFETKKELGESRDMLHSIYNSSIAGAAITSPDGKWLYVNDKLCEMLGYSRDEFRNFTWKDITPPDELEKEMVLFNQVLDGKEPAPVEKRYRRKDGRLVDVQILTSVEKNSKGRIKYFSSLIHDITEKKKMESIIGARMRLMDFSLNHTLDEVLQKTLDEATEFSGSPVGFYHFVDEDEKMLTLQAWSTRTMREYCKAEGKGSHYSLDKAGVWGDAVRERRPVVHNDYASMTGRKGLPEGHAPVIRELVVPIMRNNKIVAVLGVGNKPDDYNDDDLRIVSFFADVAWVIAEKKKTAEVLAESEKKYRMLLDTANEAIVIIHDGLLGFMNRKTIDLFDGYNEVDIAGKNFTDFIYPEDRDMVVDNYTKRIEGEYAPNGYSFRLVSSSGEIKWVKINSVLIEWEGRAATMNFLFDLTEQKAAESERKRAELFSRATLDALSSHIAILDEKGIIVSVNRAWREFAGSNAESMQGLCEGADYLGVCESAADEYREEAARSAEGIRDVIAGVKDEFSSEYPCHSPAEKRWFNMKVTRFEYDGSVRVVVAHENITKRKIAESELRSLSYVVEQSPVSIVITDKSGNIEYINPAAEKTTGYDRKELSGKNPRILKSGYLSGDEYSKLWETITSGRYWKGEFHNIRKDGTGYWEAATISPILDENGAIEHFAAVKEDITERKKSEQKIADLLKEKELLLHEVHHRIKNNMNTIRGFLFLQAADLRDASAIEALQGAANRVHSMMLLYDKLYCGHDFRSMSIKTYLEPLVDEITGNFPNSGSVVVLKNVGDFVIDARSLFPLGIIVNELISNTMKYAFSGRDQGTVNVSASAVNGRALIKVSDNGNGIPETISFEHSTGFGLSLVGMLTAQIGGSIRIERGEGTEFILEFDI